MTKQRVTFNSYDKLLSLKELKKSKHQRNKHPKEQIERLAKIMREHGVRHPIHISTLSGEVCFGHGRWAAAKLNGWKDYPVVYQQFNSEEEEYACVQSDNGIALWAELDIPSIQLDLEKLKDFDIDLLGLKDFVLEPAEKFEAQSDEDEVPEQVDTRCKLGDVWQLGRHRLMCGDSTSIDAVEKLMDGQKADMVYTDPPYGINLDTDYAKMGKKWTSDLTGQKPLKTYRKVEGDDQEFDPGILLGYFDYCKEILLWGADHYYQNLPANGSWIVWDKRRSDNFEVKEEGVDKIFGSHFEILWSKQKHRREVIRHYRVFGATEGKSGEETSGKNNTPVHHHPTQKPVPLHEKIFERIKGNLVVDIYGGSGSTLIACEKTNRKCFMMELDPHYCDVILSRWENYTGQTAERIDG